jgi:hypothetical protein
LISLLALPFAILLFPLAAAGVFFLFLLFRFAGWALRGGSQVRVPWTAEGIPRASRFAERRRTRDGAFLQTADPSQCSLVFWRRSRGCGLDPILRDAITGLTGIETIAADFSLEGRGERWLITSTSLQRKGLSMDGPHYEPWSACAGSAVARVNLSAHLDAARLLADLEERIGDPAVRHQRAPWAFVFGWTSVGWTSVGRACSRRVTCSGLIGEAILRQAASPAAAALRQALKERFTYGEITPADMARCASILGLRETRTGQPFQLRPALGRVFGLRTPDLAGRTRAPLLPKIAPDIS